MNDYKLFPTFLVVFILLVPTVIAGPLGEYTTTVGSGSTGGGIGATTTLKADGASCSVASECTGGYCNSGVCASSAPTVTPGVAAGVAGVAAAEVVTEAKTISYIQAGASETVVITKASDLKIEKIEIKAKIAVSGAEVNVKESSLASLPSGSSSPVTSDKGAILKYLEITKSNMPDASIDKVKIEFRVEKSWVTNNNIATSTIALQRLFGTTWSKLPTTLKEETATLYKFEAESPGLSFFAITGEKKAVVQVVCPSAFECCVGEVNYTDKACASGYECKNRECVAVVPVTQCPTCPSPSAWSACVEEKRTRTNYKCSADTNYECEAYTEEQTCVVPTGPSYTVYYIIGIVVFLGIIYIIYRVYVSKPFRYSFKLK